VARRPERQDKPSSIHKKSAADSPADPPPSRVCLAQTATPNLRAVRDVEKKENGPVVLQKVTHRTTVNQQRRGEPPTALGQSTTAVGADNGGGPGTSVNGR